MRLLLTLLAILFMPIKGSYYVDDAHVTSLNCGYIIPGYIEDFGFMVEGPPDKYTCHLNYPGNGFARLYARFGGIGSGGITIDGYDDCGWGILIVNFYRNGKLMQHTWIETEHCDQPAWKTWEVEAEQEFDRLEFVAGPDGNAIAIDAIRAWEVDPFRVFAPLVTR